ncbi:MAG: hypothetical protein A2Z18_06205 [Armatimonadetes bacterium RBG_16_58_9]|nr:MAG: hypothetical protein A2Z18_06205 [Armatimonadetes bacterium RBG_16_58_9]
MGGGQGEVPLVRFVCEHWSAASTPKGPHIRVRAQPVPVFRHFNAETAPVSEFVSGARLPKHRKTPETPGKTGACSGRFAIWPAWGNLGICDPIHVTLYKDAGVTGIPNPEIAREGPDWRSGPTNN